VRTVIFNGGIGNQLFEYVFMVYLWKTTGEKPAYNISRYKTCRIHSGFQANSVFDMEAFPENKKNYYSIPYRVIRKAGLKDALFSHDTNFFDGTKKCLFEGFWQDIQYYNTVKKELQALRKDLTAHCTNMDLLKALADEESVFLHIRRGDYVGDARYVNLAQTDYYEKAVQYVQDKLHSPVFYIFSDDIAWCKEYFSGQNREFRYVYYENQTALSDLCLMQACKNAIIANSSFSWWGAALDTKELVIRPKNYYTQALADTSNLYFPEWISI